MGECGENGWASVCLRTAGAFLWASVSVGLYFLGRSVFLFFFLSGSASIAVVAWTTFLYWRTVPPGHGAILKRYRRAPRVVTRDTPVSEGLKMPLLDSPVVFNWLKESVDASEDDSSILSPEIAIFLGVRSVCVRNAEVSFDDGHPAVADITVRYRIRDAPAVCASSHFPGAAFKHYITAIAANTFAGTCCDSYFKQQPAEAQAMNARFKKELKKVVGDGLDVLHASVKANPPKHMAPVVRWNDCVKQIFHYDETFTSLVERDTAYKNSLLEKKIVALQKTQKEIEALGAEKKEAFNMAVKLVSNTLTPYNGWMQQRLM